MPLRDPMLSEFGDRADSGDGSFAIAYAILRLAEGVESLKDDLCFGDGSSGPGVLSMASIGIDSIASAIRDMRLEQ